MYIYIFFFSFLTLNSVWEVVPRHKERGMSGNWQTSQMSRKGKPFMSFRSTKVQADHKSRKKATTFITTPCPFPSLFPCTCYVISKACISESK